MKLFQTFKGICKLRISNTHSCLSESVSESYSSLSEYLLRPFFLADLQAPSSVSWNRESWRTCLKIFCNSYSVSSDCSANIWVRQFLFVIIIHPHRLLPSHCIDSSWGHGSHGAQIVQRHRLEIWSGVRWYVVRRLGYLLNLEQWNMSLVVWSNYRMSPLPFIQSSNHLDCCGSKLIK